MKESVRITCQCWIFDASLMTVFQSLTLASLGSFLAATGALLSLVERLEVTASTDTAAYFYYIYKTVRLPLPQVVSVTYCGSPELKGKDRRVLSSETCPFFVQ